MIFKCYVFICIFKKAAALSLSAHVLTLPLIMNTFHEWSPFSLLFNLLLPFAFSMGICLLGLGLLLGAVLPLFGNWIHTLNGYWIASLLHTTFIPSKLIPSINMPPVPSVFICVSLIFSIFWAALNQVKSKKPLFTQHI